MNAHVNTHDTHGRQTSGKEINQIAVHILVLSLLQNI